MLDNYKYLAKKKIHGITYLTESISSEQVNQEVVKSKIIKLILNNINTHDFIEIKP